MATRVEKARIRIQQGTAEGRVLETESSIGISWLQEACEISELTIDRGSLVCQEHILPVS